MDYKFLNKVVGQIVSETIIDYDQEEIYFPFSSSPPLLLLRLSAFPSLPSPLPSFTISFFKHCREVYGLNDGEIDYVWDEYTNIILDKIKNGL